MSVPKRPFWVGQLSQPRSQLYVIYRLCERFHKWPREFFGLPLSEQKALLAYEQIRQAEGDEEVRRLLGTGQ